MGRGEPPETLPWRNKESSSIGRALAFKVIGLGFKSLLSCITAPVRAYRFFHRAKGLAQIIDKDVTMSSIIYRAQRARLGLLRGRYSMN